jgi:hypothetical protein
LRWRRSFLPAGAVSRVQTSKRVSLSARHFVYQVKRIARVAKRRRDAPGRDGLGQVDWHDEAAPHNVAHLQHFVYICLLSHCTYVCPPESGCHLLGQQRAMWASRCNLRSISCHFPPLTTVVSFVSIPNSFLVMKPGIIKAGQVNSSAPRPRGVLRPSHPVRSCCTHIEHTYSVGVGLAESARIWYSRSWSRPRQA